MIYTTQDLIKTNKNYSDVMGKISRDLRDEKIIQLKRGLYESDKNTSGHYLASYIYGPSYLSFDYVLSINGLIPEGVYRTYTSATFKKNRKKKYSNYFGDYLYRDVPEDVFRFGIKTVIENGYSYQIASVEKALCDKLYTLNPVKNLRELKFLLFNDLRIDENMFEELDFDFIIKICHKYKSTNLKLLERLIKSGKFQMNINKQMLSDCEINNIDDEKNENIKNIIKEQSSFFSFEGELSIYEDYNLVINYKTNKSINNYPVYIYNEAFVNILLLIGIEKINLNLNEPINTFINEFKNKEITLLNVLKDDTGLVDVYGVLANRYRLNDEYINLSDEDKMIYDINFNYSLISKEIIFDILNTNALQHNPGTTHDGSNIAKVLGVILIEKIFKKTYLEVLYEHLLKPLNITLYKVSEEFYRYRNDYPNVKKAFLVKDFNLFINLSLNDVYKVYKALKTEQLINKLHFEKMKELTPYSGICFYKTFAFANHFRLSQFDIYDFKNENRIIIKSNIFEGFEKNINGANKYFGDYILSRILPYYLKYNDPKLVRLSSDTIYDLLDIENDPSQMWFMGSTKYILAYEYIEPTVYNYVLVDNEIVVGTINLTIDKENNEYTISDVLIDMKYQGRGYGKALIKEALKELRKHGAKKISMSVEKINDRAVKTYLGAGFKIVESHIRGYWLGYIYED